MEMKKNTKWDVHWAVSDPRSAWFSAQKGQITFTLLVEEVFLSLIPLINLPVYYYTTVIHLQLTIFHFPKESLLDRDYTL